MKALYLDCISGISGDMMVGALIDLGVKPSALEWELSKLHIGDFHMHYDRAKRKDIEGVKFDIHGGAMVIAEQNLALLAGQLVDTGVEHRQELPLAEVAPQITDSASRNKVLAMIQSHQNP